MYVILGYGQQAHAIVRYLLIHTEEQIFTVDPIYNPHDNFPNLPKDRLIHKTGLINQTDWPSKSTVISCLPTQLNIEVAKRCYNKCCHYIDLGGDIEVTKHIEKMSEDADSSFVPDCGVAPGLVSSIAAHALEIGYKSLDIYCGGLPVVPEPPISYIETFSPEGVIKEYTGVCDIVRSGEHDLIPALSARERVFFPGLGILEAEPTSGSISLAAESLPLCTLNYKTLRYPGHWDFIKDHILTQPNPTRVLDKILYPVCPSDPDLLVLQVDLYDHVKDQEDKTYRWRWNYNHETELSAMAEITGYTVASVATMCHRDQLTPGFIPMHGLPFAELKNRIKLMPNMFQEV